jgi:NAD(P)-dependent dehydrogenase (short-subunit alcohol dehydrogenase family)
MGRLNGKVAVITGGASDIGEATARLFVDEGARVVIADIQDERGAALAAELGASAAFQRTDVTREDDVKAAVAHAVSGFGRLDCMFNNAGSLGAVGPLEDIHIDEYDRTMQVLLRSVFLGMKYAAPVLKTQASGSIISTASIAGLTAGAGPHIYSAAKAAVIHLTRSAALELAPHSVRVNCVCPGGIVTPLALGGVPMTPEVEELSKKGLAKFQPIPRAGLAADVANAVLWLASDDSTFVSGAALAVDGAYLAGTAWARQPDLFTTHRPASSS